MNLIDEVISAVNGNKESKLVSKITLHIEIRGNEVYYETTEKRGVAKCRNNLAKCKTHADIEEVSSHFKADIEEASSHFKLVESVYMCLDYLTKRLAPPEEQPLDVLFTNQPDVEEPKNGVKSK